MLKAIGAAAPLDEVLGRPLPVLPPKPARPTDPAGAAFYYNLITPL